MAAAARDNTNAAAIASAKPFRPTTIPPCNPLYRKFYAFLLAFAMGQ
jgi:hypothetical protein